MKYRINVFAFLAVFLVTCVGFANTPESSTMHFRGTLTDNGDGTYSGVVAMLDEVAEGIGDGVAGYDIYGEEGESAWFGNDPGSGPVWTSETISSYDAWPTWTPDTPDWYQYSLNLYEDGGVQKWAVRNHAGATEDTPWYEDQATATANGESNPQLWPREAKGVPMSGTMDYCAMYAEETDTGAYLPGTGVAEIPGGAAGKGGGAGAWDMDWSWGSEVVPLEVPGFDVEITDLGGGIYDVTLTPNPNKLKLNVPAAVCTYYMQPGDSITVDMDVENLIQLVNACQAMLGYSSTYFEDPTGGTIQAGGGVWDQIIWDSWADTSGISGEIDTAIGLEAQGAVGTDDDGTVAKITLTSKTGVDGTTQIVFRADADPDPGLVKSTFLSDMSAQPVWPAKFNSQTIVIDGTDPVISDIAAEQDSIDLIAGGTAIQGTVDITISASDALAGLDGVPVVTVTPFGGSSYVPAGTDNLDGTFSYTFTVDSSTENGTAAIEVTATDKSGNTANDSATFEINKNQVVATVELESLAADVTRDVTFVVTDAGDAVLMTETVAVDFLDTTDQGTATLTDVPDGAAHVSAKTAWNLRKRLDVTPVDGQVAVDFTGTDKLKGGDLNGSNSINILDYSILRVNFNLPNDVADIDASGAVQLGDYMIMRANWFQVGDDQ